jgi:hypothetical protein
MAPERLLQPIDQLMNLVLDRSRNADCGVNADLGDCHWKSPSEMAAPWDGTPILVARRVHCAERN